MKTDNPEEDRKTQDELERRRLQEYLFALEEMQERAEDLAKEHEQLKHTQDLLNAILSATTHGMCLIKRGRFVWCNRGFEDIFGWKHDELLGRTMEILFPDTQAFRRIEERFPVDLSETGMIALDDYFVHKTGGPVACLVRGRPLDAENTSGGIIFSFTDISQRRRAEEALKKAHDQLEQRVLERTRDLHRINRQLSLELTERKQAEEALRRSEDRLKTLYEESERGKELYRSLIHSSADAIVIYDMEGFTRYISPSFSQMFGWTPQDLEGKRIPFVPESERATTMAIIDDLIVNGTPCHAYETKRFTKDGRLLNVSISASRYNDHEGHPAGMLVTIRDISESKRLEAQLQRAQKMEAIATLAGGIAHNFNNILMAILGRTSIMLMGKESSHPDYEYLKAIEDHIESAASLTKQLLGFARGGRYEVKPTNVNELIHTQNRMFGETKKEIAIQGKYKPDLWLVEADQGQLNQVLMNLYINAWQAMPDGGDLTIQTDNVLIDEDDGEAYQITPGKYVKISVTDTGIGMDNSVKEKIFDPFFTTKEMGAGTGLGLASAYGIVLNHGGCINVYSEKGHGSTFEIYLPAMESADIPQRTKGRSITGIVKGVETILLVDDEDIIVEIVGALLEKLGYTLLIAKSGKEAIEIYKKHMEQIGIVMLDMIMPGMSGGETYDRLKEINPDVKVLLSSGYSLDGQASEILDRGCNGFIQKPANPLELSRKLREILDRKQEQKPAGD